MNNTEEYFRKSKGAGIDDDDFTDLGSGTGFYEGTDFAASVPEFELPEFEDLYKNEPIDLEEPEIDIPEFDVSEIDLTPPQQLISEFGLENQNGLGLGGLENPNLTNNSNLSQFTYNNLIQPDYLVFDTEYYLEKNPDLSNFSDPFQHFLYWGAAVGREYRYKIEVDYTPPEQETTENSEGIAQKYDISRSLINLRWGLANIEFFVTDDGDFLAFDTGYYLSQNPDLWVAGVDPYEHFSQFGLQEDREHRYVFVDDLLSYNSTLNANSTGDSLLNGENTTGFNPDFNPYRTFDTNYYLSQNPDVAAAGIDPYEHYVSFGQIEGRSPNVYHDLFPPSTFNTDTNIFDSSNSSFT